MSDDAALALIRRAIKELDCGLEDYRKRLYRARNEVADVAAMIAQDEAECDGLRDTLTRLLAAREEEKP